MKSPERVGDVVVRVRRGLARRAWGAAASGAVLAAGTVLLVAWALAGEGGWRQGTAWPLTLDLALVLGLFAGGWWIHRRLRRWLGEASLTSSMEDAAGLPPGAVLGSVELARGLPAGVSPGLASHGEAHVLTRLAAAEERLEGRLGHEVGTWARRARNGLVVLAPLLVMVALLSPDRAVTAWRGLGQPVQLLAGPVLPPLDVRPGDVEVERGADVDILVHAPFRDSVTLHWQAAGDVPRTAAAAVAADSGGVFRIRDVRAPVRYHVTSADGARSPAYRLVPMDPLMVTDVTVRLDYPDHTGRPVDEYRGDIPPLTVPAGTRVDVEGSASHPLEEAVLTAGTGEGVPLDVDGAEFRGSWVPRADGEYTWSFRDRRDRLAGTGPSPLRFVVVPDSAPEVVFTFPARDTVVPMNLRQPLILQVRDDYGVQAVELVAYRVTASGQRGEQVVQALDLGGPRGAVARPVLDLSGWDLVPGDTIRYHARAVDNAPSPGAGVSREWALRMPGSAEMRRDAGARLDQTAEELGRLAEDVGRAEERTRSMERSRSGDRSTDERGDRRAGNQNGEAADFQDREDVRQALEEQDELQERVDSLRRETEEMARALEEAGEANPELREDLDRLRELMEEIVPPEARERLREMLQDVETMEAGQRQEALGELQEQQTSFRERLESSLERFRRAAVDQDFRATTAEAEELARREEALSEELRSGDDPEFRAEQQEELRTEAEAMEERMERLEERLQELGETDAAREVRGARDRSAQAEASMDQAGQEAREGRPEQAGDQAASASEAMDEAAEQLREAQRQMSSEKARAFQQALNRTADDALSLAREQSRIREEMTGAAGQEMDQLRGDVAAVQQGARSLAEQMAQTASEAGAPDRQLAAEMGQAMEALERTVEAMERGTGPSPSPRGAAEQAVEALNRVARTAMEQALAMEQGGEGSQGMSAGGLQQRLQELAQQQGSLNNQAGLMMPMQLGQNAMESQARQMAEGQQAVADDLGELADEPGGEEQALGSLEAMAQEAEALARELTGGRLDAETRQRQEELFRRLLDAGRTLEKDEYSDEREASRPGAFERAEVEALDPADMNVLMYRLPSADVLQRLSPGARRLVIEYFERLNRGDPEGAAGTPPGGGGGG